MAGLVPAIPMMIAQRCHYFRDARNKSGHDAQEAANHRKARIDMTDAMD
jgi:hypothetical protein